MDLKDYLEELYPAADDEQISHYLELIRTHEQEKIPPTQAAKEYIEVSKQIKELEAKQLELRNIVVKQYETLNHQIAGLSIAKPTPRKYDNDKLMTWALTKYPNDYFDDCMSTVIDKDKVGAKIVKLILEQEINVNDLPEDIYKQGSQTRIEIEGSRKRKNENKEED